MFLQVQYLLHPLSVFQEDFCKRKVHMCFWYHLSGFLMLVDLEQESLSPTNSYSYRVFLFHGSKTWSPLPSWLWLRVASLIPNPMVLHCPVYLPYIPTLCLFSCKPFSFKTTVYLFIYGGVIENNLQELVFSFYNMVPREQTQVIRHSSSLSHFTNPCSFFFLITAFVT